MPLDSPNIISDSQIFSNLILQVKNEESEEKVFLDEQKSKYKYDCESSHNSFNKLDKYNDQFKDVKHLKSLPRNNSLDVSCTKNQQQIKQIANDNSQKADDVRQSRTQVSFYLHILLLNLRNFII